MGTDHRCNRSKYVECMRNVILTCLLSLAALQGAVAQEAVVDPPVVDPPSRVARLSYIDGDVSMAPAGTEEWAQAVLNRPLTTGDRMWVDSGARAELQVGSASIHLDQGTGFSFVDLDDDLLHMNLTEGAATIRVQRKRDNERVEIDTRNATVALLHPGEYHVEVTSAGDTVVKTRSGEAEVQGEKNSYTVAANEEGVFKGTDELTADINPLGPRTAFEDWANDRDRRDERSVSARYVSPEVIGYEDLDRDGEWISEPSYGYVWRPSYVVAGWAPYRYGRWVWVSPWGWNWIDDARWGFAPSHYGRWAYLSSRWCWVPGPRHIRPVYAPALVAWTGSPGVNVSVSFGSGVGWFPLGPREVYVPGYRYSRRYIHDVNVSNTVIINNTNITNIYNGRGGRFNYRYGHDARAVTVVQRDRFVGGRPIDGHYSRTSERDLRRWHHDPRPPAIAPDRDSVLAARPVSRPFNRVSTSRERWASNEHGAARERSFADRAPASRVSFAAERQAIAANGGRPVSRSQLMVANPRANARDNMARDNVRAGRDAADANRASTDRPGTATPEPAIRNDDTPARNDATVRALNDRPTWARQRRDESSHAQRQSRSAALSDRLREQQREDAMHDGNRRSSQQTAAGDVPATALRNEHDNQHSGSASSRSQRDERLREQGSDRNWQQPAQPRYSAPREQPRREQPRAEQPRFQQPSAPPPRIERPAPQRSVPDRPAQQNPARQQNNQQQSNQQSNDSRPAPARSFGRPSPRDQKK